MSPCTCPQALVDQLQVENHELRFGSSGGDPKGILATSSDAVGAIDKETILGGAAVLSDATKSFARRWQFNRVFSARKMAPISALKLSQSDV